MIKQSVMLSREVLSL